MKFCLIVIFVLSLSGQVLGQTDSLNEFRVSGLKLAYTYSALNNIELGYGIGKLIPVREMIGPAGYYGGFINMGYGFQNNTSLLTSKISYELMTVLIGTRLSLVNYTDFDQDQITFLPEIGLTYNALISLMYGYNLHLTGNKFDVNTHSFSISIIPYWKEKDWKK